MSLSPYSEVSLSMVSVTYGHLCFEKILNGKIPEIIHKF
jgi:hypothetical protein